MAKTCRLQAGQEEVANLTWAIRCGTQARSLDWEWIYEGKIKQTLPERLWDKSYRIWLGREIECGMQGACWLWVGSLGHVWSLEVGDSTKQQWPDWALTLVVGSRQDMGSGQSGGEDQRDSLR